MTMDSGPYRMEVTGLAGLARFAGFPRLAGLPGLGGDFSARPRTAGKTFAPGLAGLLVVLMAGVGAWVLLSSQGSSTDEAEPVALATAAITEPSQLSIPEKNRGPRPVQQDSRPKRSHSTRHLSTD
jgi:hypothetical protein